MFDRALSCAIHKGPWDEFYPVSQKGLQDTLTAELYLAKTEYCRPDRGQY